MPTTPDSDRIASLRAAVGALGLGLLYSALLPLVLPLSLTGNPGGEVESLLRVLACLNGWAFAVCTLHAIYILTEQRDHNSDAPAWLPWFRDRLQHPLLALVALVVAVWLGTALNPRLPLASESDDALRLIALLVASGAFLMYVALQYARSSVREHAAFVAPLMRLAWLAFGVQLVAALSCFAVTYTGWNWLPALIFGIALVLYLLLAEALVLAVAHFYRPARDRAEQPAGDSLLLGWCFGRANPVAVFSETLERSYGVRLQDTWVARFLGRAVEPLLLAAAILLWLSTCFTVVPVQSEGVRVTLGKFAEAPVGPGLHLTPPWPFGSIEQVDTRRVRSLEIGYGEDLGGPVLWTERHYAGEKNMLVGEGDELLTVNVPVFYRISDPIAFLRHTENAETAVGQIAFRQLVRAMASADSFAIMLSRRDAIAGRIRTGIQEEIDRLGLGLEIMFVGLKDIHPPVDVAVAYQDVISAREDKLTYVIDGETYRARRLPETEADAHRSRMEAGADAAKRVLTAAGDTARFEMVEAAQRDQPGLFRTRLQLDHAEATLSAVPKVVIDHRAKATPGGGYLLDLRRLQRQATPGGDTPATPLFDPTVTEPSPYVDENRPPPGQGGFEPAPSSEDMNLPE